MLNVPLAVITARGIFFQLPGWHGHKKTPLVPVAPREKTKPNCQLLLSVQGFEVVQSGGLGSHGTIAGEGNVIVVHATGIVVSGS